MLVCFRPTWIDFLAVLQDFDGQKEGEHELVGFKQAAADIEEQSIGESLVEGYAALCHSFCLQSTDARLDILPYTEA